MAVDDGLVGDGRCWDAAGYQETKKEKKSGLTSLVSGMQFDL